MFHILFHIFKSKVFVLYIIYFLIFYRKIIEQYPSSSSLLHFLTIIFREKYEFAV